jgi:hypothetical protein
LNWTEILSLTAFSFWWTRTAHTTVFREINLEAILLAYTLYLEMREVASGDHHALHVCVPPPHFWTPKAIFRELLDV